MSDALVPDVSELQRGIVETKINAGDMFTALDITREAQHGHGVFAKHDDIKGYVHDLFHNAEMGNYNRTLITIDGVPGEVFCYYDPNISDPSEYRSRWIGVRPGGAPNDPGLAPQAEVPALAFSNDDGNMQLPSAQQMPPQGVQGDYDRDKRGRLWVSKPLISQLNVKEGDTVFVLIEPAKVIITSDANKAVGKQTRLYRVDRHGNVAVSKVNFSDAGIDYQSVDANVENGDIVISKPQ